MLSKTFDRKLMLDLLICISEDVKKNLFFAGVRKKTGLSHSGVGGLRKLRTCSGLFWRLGSGAAKNMRLRQLLEDENTLLSLFIVRKVFFCQEAITRMSQNGKNKHSY